MKMSKKRVKAIFRAEPSGGSGRAVLFLLAAAALFLPGCRRGEKEASTTCVLCGMDASRSKGRFILDFADGTRLDTCSGACAARLASLQKAKLYRIQVYASDREALIDGRKAVYVLGSRSIPEGSMAPSVFSFSSEKEANNFVSKEGGRIGRLEDVMAILPLE